MKTIVAMYDNITDAQRVVQALIDAGIDRDQINVIANNSAGATDSTWKRVAADARDDDMNATAGGAATGAVVGGVGGVLLSLSALAIPGIGPVIAAGPLVAGLVGAGVGAAVGGLVGALVDMGIPEEHAGYYAEGIRRGDTLVSVQVPDPDADNTVRILDRFNPVDINQRVASWRASGWTGPSAGETAEGWSSRKTSETVRGSRQSTKLDDGDEVAVDVVEEDLHVGKRQVQGDTVRVRKQVVEKPVEEQVRLREEQVRVERRPADRPASEADLHPFEDEVIEVDTMREEAVIEKQPRVVEEVLIKKDTRERTETIRDTVRRTEVDVEGADDDFRTYDTSFRNHYQSTFANSGYTYEQYEPAYRYGYTLASDPRYRGREWNAIEPDARTYWSQHYPDSPWENFKDAIRQGWQRVRQAVNG